MIRKIKIENFKSIHSLEMELGRFNVFIGENGCGKTNILEAIGMAGAASAKKLDNEFLGSRGIRVTNPVLMRSAFEKGNEVSPILIDLDLGFIQNLNFQLSNNNQPYSKWISNNFFEERMIGDDIIDFDIYKMLNKAIDYLFDFLIFCPENTFLRDFERPSQIEPLGIKGEGLFKLLTVFNEIENDKENDKQPLTELIEHLQVFDWFDNLEIKQSFFGERSLTIEDRFLEDGLQYITQRSANEGFLFLLFYFSLFISEYTPKFFAIDNIENALNPKLCRKLMTTLYTLAEKHDKQVIFTTHNPAVLDGLNLNDEEQRLFVIQRNKLGHTKANRIQKKAPLNGKSTMKLSEAFINGYLGGLPKSF